MCRCLWHTPRLLNSLLESEIWSVMLRPGRKPLSTEYQSVLIQSFRRNFFKVLDNVNVNYLKIPENTRGARS